MVALPVHFATYICKSCRFLSICSGQELSILLYFLGIIQPVIVKFEFISGCLSKTVSVFAGSGDVVMSLCCYMYEKHAVMCKNVILQISTDVPVCWSTISVSGFTSSSRQKNKKTKKGNMHLTK